jgi:ABC-2 type transport system permease protein
MSMTAIWALVLRQMYLLRSGPTRVLSLIVWVAIDIVLWGFMTKYLNTVTTAGFDFVPVLLGAVLLWDFFTRVMFGVSMAFFEDVWSRNFLNVFGSPVSINEYLAGLVASSIITSAFSLVIMLLLAIALFGLSFVLYGGMLAAFLLVLFLFGIALGIVGCSFVLRFGPSAEWFVWPIPALLSPFAGVFYPISTMPVWIQWIAHLLPPMYVFEGMRAIVTGGTMTPSSLVIGAVLAVAYVLGSSLVFTRVYRNAVRTGLIARYSAETVT